MAIEIGLYIEAQEGVTWDDWRRLATQAEALGFDMLVSSVHLQSLQASGRWALDLWPVMTALALWTHRIRFGPMVLPITFYHPVQIARLSATLDRLSGGRFRLGLGAGRHPGEHEAFGLPFPEHEKRVAMLDEAVQIIRLLWEGEPISFEGRWYRLKRAQVSPVPECRWIGVGGNSIPTLSVAAARANEWCTAGASPQRLQELTTQLDSLAKRAGREPREIERTLMNGTLVGRDHGDLGQRASRLASLLSKLAAHEPSAILDRAATEWAWWVGMTDQVAQQVRDMTRAGLNRVVFQVFDFRDLAAIELIARDVVPLLQA